MQWKTSQRADSGEVGRTSQGVAGNYPLGMLKGEGRMCLMAALCYLDSGFRG